MSSDHSLRAAPVAGEVSSLLGVSSYKPKDEHGPQARKRRKPAKPPAGQDQPADAEPEQHEPSVPAEPEDGTSIDFLA